VRWCGRRRTS